ncbi:hypothetical protein TRFO_34720 [Tritrichomonas foetus]|uniref:Uncharacterized protein n=1 Tax=Tritrichomonas foetus TaxID=1144522 RepID=A0A1J4JNT1_9EUKA|nr:hypothetical protein TRFO_34720 [Tritrichomonas foetus]|eukprot:OHS98924.1 hypothetical protein TRFO_34720 [Tritrichomonas foetus]
MSHDSNLSRQSLSIPPGEISSNTVPSDEVSSYYNTDLKSSLLGKKRDRFILDFEESMKNTFTQENKLKPAPIWKLTSNNFPECDEYEFLKKHVLGEESNNKSAYFPYDFDVLASILSPLFLSILNKKSQVSLILVIREWNLLPRLLSSFKKYGISNQIEIEYIASRQESMNKYLCHIKNGCIDCDSQYINTNLDCSKFCPYFLNPQFRPKRRKFNFINLERNDSRDIEDLFSGNTSCPIEIFQRYHDFNIQKEKRKSIILKIATRISFLDLLHKRSLFYGLDFDKMFENEKIIFFNVKVKFMHLITTFTNTTNASSILDSLKNLHFDSKEFPFFSEELKSIISSFDHTKQEGNDSNIKQSSILTFEKFYQEFLKLDPSLQLHLFELLPIIKLKDNSTSISDFINDQNYFEIPITLIDSLYKCLNVLPKTFRLLSPVVTANNQSVCNHKYTEMISIFLVKENKLFTFDSIDEKADNRFGKNVIRTDHDQMIGVRILHWYPQFYQIFHSFLDNYDQHTVNDNLILTGSPGIGKSSIIPYLLLRLVKDNPVPLFEQQCSTQLTMSMILVKYYQRKKANCLDGTVFLFTFNQKDLIIGLSYQEKESSCDISTIYFSEMYLIPSNNRGVDITPKLLSDYELFKLINKEISNSLDIVNMNKFPHCSSLFSTHHQSYPTNSNYGFHACQKKGNVRMKFVYNNRLFHFITILDGNVTCKDIPNCMICASHPTHIPERTIDCRYIYAPLCTANELRNILRLRTEYDNDHLFEMGKTIAEIINMNIRKILYYSTMEKHPIQSVVEKVKNHVDKVLEMHSSALLKQSINNKSLVLMIAPSKLSEERDINSLDKFIRFTSRFTYNVLMKRYELKLTSHAPKISKYVKELIHTQSSNGFLYQHVVDLNLSSPCVFKCKKVIRYSDIIPLLDNNEFNLMINACQTVNIPTNINTLSDFLKYMTPNDNSYYFWIPKAKNHTFYDQALIHKSQLFLFRIKNASSHSFKYQQLKAILEQCFKPNSNEYCFDKLTIIYQRDLPLPSNMEFVKEKHVAFCAIALTENPKLEIICSEINIKKTIEARQIHHDSLAQQSHQNSTNLDPNYVNNQMEKYCLQCNAIYSDMAVNPPPLVESRKIETRNSSVKNIV